MRKAVLCAPKVKPEDFETTPLEEFCKCLSDQEIRLLLPISVRVLSRNP